MIRSGAPHRQLELSNANRQLNTRAKVNRVENLAAIRPVWVKHDLLGTHRPHDLGARGQLAS